MAQALFGSPRLSVTPATDDDLPEVLEIYRRVEDFLALGPVPTASMEMVLEDLKHSREESGVFCVVRGSGGGPVAVLDFVPRRAPGLAFLSLLMIAAPHRGRGIGTEVVELLEGHLRERYAVRAIESGVQINNEQGIRFWTAHGYRIVSGPHVFPDRTVAYGLRKEL
jgi:ribosomal protein S18 acetylase RimI-like enzyme